MLEKILNKYQCNDENAKCLGEFQECVNGKCQ